MRVMRLLIAAALVAMGLIISAEASHIHSTQAERTLEEMLGRSGHIERLRLVGQTSDTVSKANEGQLIYDRTQQCFAISANGGAYQCLATGGSAAPTNATYITQTPDATLTNEQALSSLSTGALLNTTGTGVLSIYGGAACTNQFVRALNPSLAATCNSVSLTADVTGTLPVANGGTNATATPTAGAVAYGTGTSYAFSAAGTVGQALVSGGTSTPTWFAPTVGSVIFAGSGGALNQDNSNLFWDDAMNRLGVRTASPTASIHTAGDLRAEGPVAIGGAVDTARFFYVTGTGSSSIGTELSRSINQSVDAATGVARVGQGTTITLAAGLAHTSQLAALIVMPPTISLGTGATANTSDTLLLTGAPSGATNNYAFRSITGPVVITAAGNFGVGTATPGALIHFSTSANNEIFIETTNASNRAMTAYRQAGTSQWRTGVVASTHYVIRNASNADIVTVEQTGTANSLYVRSGARIGLSTPTPTNILSLGGNSARTIWMERHTTADTPGNSLTIQAGGATSGATDRNGGDLILAPGTSTGSGRSKVQIQSSIAGGAGTADRAPATHFQISQGHIEALGTTPTISAGCGTGATIVGNDNNGTITTQASGFGTCTVTFANAWSNAPQCVLNNQTSASVTRVTSPSTTGITITGATGGDVIDYLCRGRS